MITVAILINGQPLVARACRKLIGTEADGKVGYKLDDGSIVYHDPRDGAVALAKLMLGTIKLDGEGD